MRSLLARSDATLAVSAGFLGALLLIALLGPWIAPHDPTLINHTNVLKRASAEHWMGTDEFGRDILSRLIIGIRPTLIIAFGATAMAAVIGVALGVGAGFIGRTIEFLMMRGADIMLGFPPILLTLLVIGFWPAGVGSLLVTIGLIYAPHFARVAHAATLQVMRQDFIDAERAMGTSEWRIITRGVLPNILPALVVQATLTVAAAILVESGASFLGLGIKPPEPSWGQMIGTARGYLSQAPMYTFWPALFLAGTVLAINLVGDRLRDLLDPRLSA